MPVFKFVFLALTLALPGLAGQGEPNCKLSIQVLNERGKKRLDITEIYAIDREDCKYAAYLRRKEELDRDAIVSVKVFFAFDGRRRAN